MKEKRYTLPDKQEAAFAGEPTIAYHGNATVAYTEVKEDDMEEDFDWNRMPYTWGPANEEEAIARIEAIEAENEEYTDIEDFERKLKEKFPWLA